MATQILGKVKMINKGAYDNATTYNELDIVTYEGSSYSAKQETTGNLPTNTTYWELLASKGDKGDTGNTGATGATPNISVKSTTTGEAGTDASVSLDASSTPEAPKFNFTIPRGDKGNTGNTGATGATPNISVGTVTTGSAGSSANVELDESSTAENPVFNFTIPRGQDGEITYDKVADEYSNASDELYNTVYINKEKQKSKDILPSKTVEGESIGITDGQPYEFLGLEIGGNTTQDGTPSPDNEVQINTVTGDVVVSNVGKNLCKLVYNNMLPNSSGTVINSNYPSIILDTKNKDSLYISGVFTMLSDNIIRFGGYSEYPQTGSTGTRADISQNGVINISLYNYVLLTFIYTGGASTDTDKAIEDKFMVCFSSTPEPYEPYISYNKTLSLGNIEHCKIDTARNRIYRENDITSVNFGKWYLRKETGKVILDGSENWTDRPNYTYADRFVLDDVVEKNGNLLSNYFLDNLADTNFYPGIRTSSKQLIINFGEKGTTTLEQFKTWLSTHNTKVYYPLSTPTTTEITGTLAEQLEELYQAGTFKGVNNITTDTIAELKIKYAYDIEKYINSLEARIELLEQ